MTRTRTHHWPLLVAILLTLVAYGSPAHADCFKCQATYQGTTVISFSCPLVQNDGGTGCVATITSCRATGRCTYVDPNCFLAGTQVSTPHGLRSIESLEVGDAVRSIDSNGSLTTGMVTEVVRAVSHSYLVINGQIRVTPTHRFLVTRDSPMSARPASTGTEEPHSLGVWRRAENLSEGDVLLDEHGRSVIVDSVVPVSKGVRVFNLEIDTHHTFIADGIVVHNQKPDYQG